MPSLGTNELEAESHKQGGQVKVLRDELTFTRTQTSVLLSALQ